MRLDGQPPLRSFLNAVEHPLHHFVSTVPLRLQKLQRTRFELGRMFFRRDGQTKLEGYLVNPQTGPLF